MGWRLTTAAEAPAPKPLREFDVDLTVYVKETQVVDGHGTTLLLEIVNTSGHKVRVTGPPLVRRLEAGEGQRRARAGRAVGEGPSRLRAMVWPMLAVVAGFLGLAVLGVLAVRVFLEAQRLGRQVADSARRISRAAEDLERAAVSATRAAGPR